MDNSTGTVENINKDHHIQAYVEWTPDHETILVDWADKALCYRWLHSKSHNNYERVRQFIVKSNAWQTFKNSQEVQDIGDAAAALQCSPASPQTTWQSRINNLKRASDVLNDNELMEFAELLDNKFVIGKVDDN